MTLFGLTPDPAALDDPDWAGSTHRGPCYVAAPTERTARLYAANAFGVIAVRTPGGLLPASPWTQPRLVAVEQTIGLGAAPVPDGTVMVPSDPHDPRGAYHVAQRG